MLVASGQKLKETWCNSHYWRSRLDDAEYDAFLPPKKNVGQVLPRTDAGRLFVLCPTLIQGNVNVFNASNQSD